MSSYLIGLDIGTGSTKALAVDSTGKVLSSAQVAYTIVHPEADRSEQDPEVIWQAFCKCIAIVVESMQEKPTGIALSSAMHSIMVINDQHKPITPLIIWADNRARHIASTLRKSASGEMLYEQTGTPLHAMSPLAKIIWFRENDSDIFLAAFKFISIKEYIWFKLFGLFEADYSIASASGLMDIISLSWNKNALALAGISENQISILRDTNFSRTGLNSEAAIAMGISVNTPLIIGGSDGCMANLGSFATGYGVGALTIGTSGAVRVASEKPVYNFEAMTFNYRLDSNTFICGGPTNNGGVVLKWYAETMLGKRLASASDYTELLKDVEAIDAGAEGLVFLPYILGERAPIWNSDACGVFFGIKTIHTQKHFTRAVVEGISMALYNIAENMERCGLHIEQINASGGFIQSAAWLQILADMFGKKFSVINTGDASALGAAYIGLKETGMIENYESLHSIETNTIIPNAANYHVYQQKYLLFKRLYKVMCE
jgi:gluconokinase